MYVIDHYYYNNHQETSLVLLSSYDTEDMIGICCALEFFYEEIYGDTALLSQDLLNKCLINIYGCKDVKNTIDISTICLPVENACKDVLIRTEQGELYITIIDVCQARENYLDKIEELKAKWINKKSFEKRIRDIFKGEIVNEN